jgi:hypothetical protein
VFGATGGNTAGRRALLPDTPAMPIEHRPRSLVPTSQRKPPGLNPGACAATRGLGACWGGFGSPRGRQHKERCGVPTAQLPSSAAGFVLVGHGAGRLCQKASCRRGACHYR